MSRATCIFRRTRAAALALALACAPMAHGLAGEPEGAGNLLRNGSFEGSLKYWHRGLDSRLELVKGDAASGEHCLRLPKGHYPWSAPFVLEPGEKVTLSASLRSEGGEGSFHVFLVPTCRSAGKEPFRLFWGKSGFGTRVTWKEWRRVSWDVAIPDAKTLDYRTWWDGRTWFVVPTGENVLLDDIAVIRGEKQETWRPYSPVEVTVLATNLPPWRPSARILEKGAEVALEAALFNPGQSPLAVRLDWELADYTGSRVLARLGSEELTLEPNRTRRAARSLRLDTNGLVLARATVLDISGRVLGRSEQPLTTLPFPKAATRPNWDERIGGGVAAGNPHPTHLLEAARKIGFGWSRWYPHLNWERCQPQGPDKWDWPDAIVNDTLAAGIGINAVLYARPKWAFDEKKSKHLPKDMADWGPADRRWEDLSIVTAWDRFVTEVVKRYSGRAVAWEVVNEPEWEHWDPAIYTQFVRRTSRLVKRADPRAVVMVDGVYGVDGLHRKWLELGGAKDCDVFTFHMYGLGEFYSGDGILGIRQTLDAAGGKHVRIWFNEGWTHFPSSEDYPAQTLVADRTAARVVHGTVRTVAETFAAGMEKFIMFHLGYDHQGRSWWDWDGDGTSLYDDCHQPTALVPAFNVLCHNLGLSRHTGTVKADGAVFHVFQDERQRRGVAVAWAERKGVAFELPLEGLAVMDVMGNSIELPSSRGKTKLSLGEPWTPVYVYSRSGASGEALARALAPFERPSLVVSEGVYTLPTDWLALGEKGNPYLYKGRPIWTLGRVYPPDPTKVSNYRRFPNWFPPETKWTEFADSQGGNPAAGLAGGLRITVMTEWKPGDMAKPSALLFHAPEASEYEIDSELVSERWTGGGNCFLELYTLDRASGQASRIARLELPDRKPVELKERARLAAGQELAFVYGASGWHTGAGLHFKRLIVARAGARRPLPVEGADPAHAPGRN